MVDSAFVELVRQMREKQKAFFAARNSPNNFQLLNEAKALEARVDRVLAHRAPMVEHVHNEAQ